MFYSRIVGLHIKGKAKAVGILAEYGMTVETLKAMDPTDSQGLMWEKLMPHLEKHLTGQNLVRAKVQLNRAPAETLFEVIYPKRLGGFIGQLVRPPMSYKQGEKENE